MQIFIKHMIVLHAIHDEKNCLSNMVSLKVLVGYTKFFFVFTCIPIASHFLPS